MILIFTFLITLFNSLAFSAPNQHWSCTGFESSINKSVKFDYLSQDWTKSSGYQRELVLFRDEYNRIIDLKSPLYCFKEGIEVYPEVSFRTFNIFNDNELTDALFKLSYGCGDYVLKGFCTKLL